MRDEDLENYREQRPPRSNTGWTQMPNELLEQLPLTELSPLQYKILLIVYRYSIGFNRRHCDRLTLRGIAKKVGREWSGHFREACSLLEAWNMIGVVRPARRGARAVILPVTDPRRWRLPEQRRQNLPTPGEDLTGEELEQVVAAFFGRESEEVLIEVVQAPAPDKEERKKPKKDFDSRVHRFATERGVEVVPRRVLQRISIDDGKQGRDAIA